MRHDPDALMLFAAGFGTRMGALTRDRPKPLIEVAGRPMIDHAVDLAREAGISQIVANAHYLHETISSYLAPRGIPVSVETPEILDTGGGLRAALPLLGPGPVLTLNTDAIFTGPNPLTALRHGFAPDRMGALLMLAPFERARGRSGTGDFTLHADGRITRGGNMVFTGAQAMDPLALSDIPARCFSLNAAWDRLAKGGRLFGIVHTGGWCDVGHPDGIALAEALLTEKPRG